MANRTVKDAVTVKGTNPQYLVEKIIRSRVYDSRYWKEECFALSAELLVDKAMQLKYVGGIFGDNVKATPFLCLVLKMLQIQPEKDIVIEFIKNEDYKYVRVLGAYYLRLTGTSLDCYNYIEPLLNDYRKLRIRNRQGGYELSHIDEFIDQLLREERMCDVILPRIQRRDVHEEGGELEPRVSALDDDLDDLPPDEDDEEEAANSADDLVMTRSTTLTTGGASELSRHGHRDTRHGESHRRPERRSGRYREERAGGHSGDRHARERRSDRHRSRSRERERRERGSGRSGRDRDRDKQHERRRHEHHRNERHRDSRRKRHRSGSDEHRREMEEANALRAKLGLAPLRP